MERYLKATFAESNIDVAMNGIDSNDIMDLAEGLIIIASRKQGVPVEKVLNRIISNVIDAKKEVIKIIKFQDRKGE